MNRFLVLTIVVVLLFVADWYVFQSLRQWNLAAPSPFRKTAATVAGVLAVASLVSIVLFFLLPRDIGKLRNVLGVIIFANLLSKLLAAVLLFADDLGRLGRWVTSLFSKPSGPVDGTGPAISRSDFMVQAAVVAGSIPLVGITYGILSGAHDYRVRRVTVKLPNLPKAFDGLRIAQLSDIHSGSFFNKTAVQGGVNLLLREKPDVVFFTGDLVNNVASEVQDYIPIFQKVKAPLGVYSTLGNHDYGDYVAWPSLAAKRQNLENLKHAHGLLGWNLLMNQHRMLKEGGEQLAIIGIENWGGKGHFPKYGKLGEARQGTEAAPVKLLLSHDPSHWEAQVLPEFPDIDLMFAGHTHGMQFGVELPGLKWSPVQYMYKQWAGLYEEAGRYLYVNRGYGYLGFPGRIGILPEITIVELKKA
ncbi:MAG: metallophosphoesterase [Cytophagales bacterium]|nr:metallophosphoesterase [Cytophagales bacterium]